MKIAIIADALDTQQAGIHVYVKELLNAIYSLDCSHDIHIIRASENKNYPKWKEHYIKVKRIPFHIRWRQLTSIPALLNKLNPDIVFETAHFGPFRLRKEIKRVTMIHDLTPILFPEYHSFSSYIAHKLLLKGIIKRADHVIVNSKHTQSDLAEWSPVSRNKSKVVHLAPLTKLPTNNDLPVIEGRYILTVGTIEPRKNHLQLIEAFENLRNSRIKLVIAGSIGWKSKKIVTRIKNSTKKDSIKLMGRVSNKTLANLYQNAEMMVYPSYYEGFGLPVLEAMSCGTPVIVSNVSSLPEIIGTSGLTFPPNNQDQLVEKINQLLDNESLVQALSKKSLQQAAKFSWDKTAKETLAVFEQLMT